MTVTDRVNTRPQTMKAAMYYAPGQARYEDTAIPSVGSGEILVQVGAALTCGTDLKCLRRGHPVLLKSLPSPFGHEFAGTVVELGEGVERFQLGDRVVAANSAPCYNCFYCQKGKYNLCEELDLLNGAYAQYLKIPARIVAHNTHRIPEYLPFELAAFTEPLAVSLRGVELAGVASGDQVAVLGTGAIGQLVTRLCKWKGAHVTTMGRNPHKLALAQTFGQADRTVNLTDWTNAQAIREKWTPQGQGFDVVIEAIGLPHTWELAIELVRRGGVVNLFGGCPAGSSVSLDTQRLHYDEITLISPFHHTPYHVKKAFDLLTSLDINPAPLITEQMPMSAFEQALSLVEQGKALKIILTPD